MQTIDWTAVGSGATALAAVAAFLTIYITVRNSRKEVERQGAALIRQNLRALINQSHTLKTQLREGHNLIFGSSSVAKELQSRLSSSADKKEFWYYVNNDYFLLSVAVIGWHSSPLTEVLMNSVGQIEQCVSSLNGKLVILSYPVAVLRNIVDEAWSPLMFRKILLQIRREFFQEYKEEGSIDKLINALTLMLQGGITFYVKETSYGAIEPLDTFIKVLANKLLDLDDAKLLKISTIKVSQAALAQEKPTGSIKAILDELESYFPEKSRDHDTLCKMTNEIEKLISGKKCEKE